MNKKVLSQDMKALSFHIRSVIDAYDSMQKSKQNLEDYPDAHPDTIIYRIGLVGRSEGWYQTTLSNLNRAIERFMNNGEA